MSVLALFLSQTAALLLVAVSIPRHQRDLFGKPLTERAKAAARAIGLVMLFTVVGVTVHHEPATGCVHLCGIFPIAALTVTAALAQFSRSFHQNQRDQADCQGPSALRRRPGGTR